MKQGIFIGVSIKKNKISENIGKAEKAVEELRKVIHEIEMVENGGSIWAEVNSDNLEASDKQVFYVSKRIDTAKIKEPLEKIGEMLEPLKKQVKELDNAIITEITKEAPRT